MEYYAEVNIVMTLRKCKKMLQQPSSENSRLLKDTKIMAIAGWKWVMVKLWVNLLQKNFLTLWINHCFNEKR